MKPTRKIFLRNLLSSASVSFSLFLTCACSDSSTGSNDVAGGATDIGNSIAGIVVDAGGAGVASARVVAYYDSWEQISATDSIEAITDSNGNFSLDIANTEGFVIYAENGSECGLVFASNFASDSANKLILGNRKSLESSVSGETSGYMRIVGTHETAEIREDGSFEFEAIPPGEISLVYIRDEKPQGYLEFKTVDEREQIHLPPLENRRDDGHFNAPDFDDDMFGVDFWHHGNHSDFSTETVLHMDNLEPVFNSDHSKAGDVNYTNGISRAAISLKAGQFIELENQRALGDDFTISLWTKWNGANGGDQILFSEKFHGDSIPQMQWYFDSAENNFAVKVHTNHGTEAVHFEGSAPKEQWMFIALVSRNRAISMYINGERIPSSDSSAATISLDSKRNPVLYSIGGAENLDATWSGALDEYHIEGIAQSADWIKDVYEMTQKNFKKNNGK